MNEEKLEKAMAALQRGDGDALALPDNFATIQAGIKNQGYYLVGNEIRGTDSQGVWSKSKKIRDYLIVHANALAETQIALLKKKEALVNANAMPDGYDQKAGRWPS
ncbi:MAG: hypothetical protein WCS90_00125 [Bacilli bacterium]